MTAKFYRKNVAEILVSVVLALVPFHAFLTIWLSTAVGHFTFIRLWKEYVLISLFGVVCVKLAKNKQLREKLRNDTLVKAIAVYLGLLVLTGLASFLMGRVSAYALLYGWLLDARFLVWFLLVLIIAGQGTLLKIHWKKLIFIPFSLVVMFGLLQFFVLPRDFLNHFGYNNGSTSFVSVIPLNQDSPTIRIQSFLRGANPLGAYLAVVILLLVAVLQKKYIVKQLALVLSGSLALFLTFSRSALLGFMTGLGIIVWSRLQKRMRYILLAAGLSFGIILWAFTIALRIDSVQNVILHTNDSTTASVTSNEGHANSTIESFKLALHNPAGLGPGAAGQASWYNHGHEIINTESYFLQILLETGFLGFLAFATVLYMLAKQLWLRHSFDGLALGLLAGLGALIVINMFSFGWTDDTLAFLWWGLAGIALSKRYAGGTAHEKAK